MSTYKETKKTPSRPFTAIGTVKVESLITTLSNIENTSSLRTLSNSNFNEWMLDGTSQRREVKPLQNSNNYNIQVNNVVRPLTSHNHKNKNNECLRPKASSHTSIIPKESSQLINEILAEKENHTNDLPQHLQQFKNDLIYAEINTQLQLPILGILSPGRKKKASYLPPPNDIENKKLLEYENKVKTANVSELYHSLSREPDTNDYYKTNIHSNSTSYHFDRSKQSRIVETIDPYSQRYYNCTARYLKRQEDRKEKENDYLSKYAYDFQNIPSNGQMIGQNNDNSKLRRSKTAKRVKSNPLLSPVRNISTAPARTPTSSNYLGLDQKNNRPSKTNMDTFADLFFETKTIESMSTSLYGKDETLSVISKPEKMQTKVEQYLVQTTIIDDSITGIIESAFDDLGLDLNPLHNKKRYFGNSFMLLLYYYNYFRQKQGFLQLHEQCKKSTASRQKNAGILIVRISRGLLGRMKTRAIRYNLQRQFDAKAEYERQLQLHYDLNASRITRSVIIYVKTKIIMRRNIMYRQKATLIQKVVRGYFVRHRIAIILQMRMKLKINSIKIQCAYRQRLANKRVVLFRKLRNIRLKDLEISKNLEMRKDYLRRQGAGVVIQRYYAAYKIRKRLKSMLFWHHEHLVTVTQARFRGFKVRKWYMRLKRLKKLKYTKQNNAIVKLQKIWRGYSKRKIYKGFISEKKEKLKEKKLLKQEKMKAYYFIINFLDRKYKVNPYRFIRTILRKSMPLRYMFEEPYIVIIQSAWRKYYAQKRVFRLRVIRNISEMMKRNRMKLIAAIMFQSLYRGYNHRLKEMRKKRIQMCVRIQCAIRYKQAALRVYRIRARVAATIVIRRNLIIVLEARQLKKIRTLKRIYDKKSRIIQRLMRRYLSRKYFSYIKNSIRAQNEYTSMARFHVDCLIVMVQLKILRESLKRDIGDRSQIVQCNQDCIALGPVQAIFLSALGERALYEEKQLIANKLDLQTLTKFANKLNDAFALLSKTSTKSGISRKGKQPLLSKLLERRSLELPPLVVKKLSTIDVSVAMSSSKTESGNFLFYLEFVDWIYRIGDVFFKEVKRNRRVSLLGAASTTLPKSQFNIQNNHDPIDVNEEQEKQIHKIRSDMIIPFKECKTDLGLACVIRILSLLSVHSDFLNIPKILIWLENESLAKLEVFVIRIQSMYRSWKGRRTKKQMLSIREQVRRSIIFHKAGTVINTWIRRFVHKHRGARLAQKVLIHYFPPNVPDYWYNPRTTRTHPTKPRILLKYECLPVPLPENGFECIANCIFCNQKAQVNCSNCEESLCFSCYKSSHSKGTKKVHHHFTYIPTCCNCKYQNATKNCLTCIIQRPKPGELVREVAKGDRGLYCDSCFSHTHDQLQQVNDENHPIGKFRQYALLSKTKEAYLKNANLQRKLLCDHKYDALVEPCGECSVNSASWRCRDCHQLYCHVCLSHIHTAGVFKKHVAERLPYFTVEMARSYRQQEAIHRTQNKFNKLKNAEARRREKFRLESIVKIQTWYRKLYWGRKGQRHMKALRIRMRRDFKYRKKETSKKRNTFTYKVLDFFSKAPILFSDTKEEKILKRVNIFWRQSVKQIIWKNQSDWGFYKHLNPCKGIPKRGFDVGTIEELIDQSQNGG